MQTITIRCFRLSFGALIPPSGPKGSPISRWLTKAVTFPALRYLTNMEKIIGLALIAGTVAAIIHLTREPKLTDAAKLEAEWRG